MKSAVKIAEKLDLKIDEILILQGAHTKLLLAAAAGKIDLNHLAREELANRGLDCSGRWVGFKAAADIHQVQ